MSWATIGPLWALLQLLLIHFEAEEASIQYDFLLIHDTTFLCADAHMQFKRAELTDDDKMSILESKGGQYLAPYMARDHRSAQENFFNPLPFQSFVEQVDANSDKEDRYAFISPVDKRTLKQKAAVLNYLKTLMDTESQQLAEDIVMALDATTSEAEAEAILTNRILQSKRRRRRRHVTTAPPNQPREKPTHHFNSTRYRNAQYVLPEELAIKPFFSKASGVETSIDYCLPRGTTTADGNYLHMCTTCAATTTLPENYYPRVINEAVCSAQDAYCFYFENIPHGACKQRQLPVNILRKNEGYCTLALKDGGIVVVDEWDLTSYALNVACECTINKNSQFANCV